MNRAAKTISILSLILPIFTSGICQAQDTTSSDGLFSEARRAAFKEDNYSKAIAYCKKALQISPRYTDIIVFTGRLYTWSKNYDSAQLYFRRAIATSPSYTDAYVAYTDMEYWQDHNDTAMAICQAGLVHDSASIDLRLRKAKVLYAVRQFRAAGLLTDSILKADKTNTDARALAGRIRDQISINTIGMTYNYVYFDKQFSDPWHLATLDYTRNTRLGSITGHINYANRFKENGFQYEVESYPHISKTFYGYLDGGYSDNVGVFPHWRAGASLFSNLPHAFETEVGWRYLYFTDPTSLFTIYIGKYYRNYLFGARTYLTPDNNRISQSYSAFVRYYFGGADDYVTATVGTGISPDDRTTAYQLYSNYKLITYKAGIDATHVIKRLNIISFNLSIINQEYLPHVKGNQIQAGLGYQRRF